MKINTFRYTPETVDCRLCTEYISKKRGCRQQICPWIAERIEAGVVGYSEAVFGNAPHDKELLFRLCNLIQGFPGSLWKDKTHSLRMEQMDMELGALFGLWFQSVFVGITMWALTICIFIITYGRMIEIYLVTSVAPIPMATMLNKESGGMGQNYLRSLFALAFQAFLIIV